LNMKAVARKVAANLRKKYAEAKLIVAHLGTGVTLSVHKGGKMIDIVDGREEGPFSPDRCGGLPVCQLIELCYSGKYTFQEMRKKVTGSGGLFAYLGTRDIRQVEKLAAEGNEQAEILLQALAYQVSKEIGALAAVVAGDVDQVVLTGGMAYSSRIVNDITTRVTFIAPVSVVPGEEELESLAAGALRVLNGEEPAKCYE
ncbi:MAG: Butyrate kinase, partial [Sporomusa sp.]|nr:Butyrate kinase [Sporomusa sp.]